MNTKTGALIILIPAFGANDQDDNWLPASQAFVKNLTGLYPGIRVIILAFNYPLTKGDYQLHGARVISFGALNRSRFKRWLTWISILFMLYRLKREHSIIGLLSFWLGTCALVGNLFAKLYKIKHYIWIQGQDAKAGNKTFRWIRPRAGELVALSDFIADEFNRNYSIRPAHVVPISVDTGLFPHGEYKRTIDVMGAGTLMPLKRYGLFVSIIESLALKVPGLNVVHCGGGIEKEKLLKQIGDSGLQETISLLGEVPHWRVLELMVQSKVFLHTSEYEGFGAVCAEALAAGAHVVSFVRPMKQVISQWHIVHTKEEAEQKLLELLESKNLLHEKVVPFPAAESCRKIMALYTPQSASWRTAP